MAQMQQTARDRLREREFTIGEEEHDPELVYRAWHKVRAMRRRDEEAKKNGADTQD